VEWKRRGWGGKSVFFRSLFSGGTEAAVVVTVDRVFLVPVGSRASFSRRSRASKADSDKSFIQNKNVKDKKTKRQKDKKTKRQKDKKTKRQKDKKTKRQKDKKTKRQKDKKTNPADAC